MIKAIKTADHDPQILSIFISIVILSFFWNPLWRFQKENIIVVSNIEDWAKDDNES